MLEWIILECLNCDVERARESGWRSEVVLSEPATLFSWQREDARTFQTRRACLHALRREQPESDWSAPDAYGQINKTTHGPDYVERFSAIPGIQNAALNIGCFSVDEPTG